MNGSGISIFLAVQIVSRALIVYVILEMPRVVHFVALFRFLISEMYYTSFLRVAAQVAWLREGTSCGRSAHGWFDIPGRGWLFLTWNNGPPARG